MPSKVIAAHLEWNKTGSLLTLYTRHFGRDRDVIHTHKFPSKNFLGYGVDIKDLKDSLVILEALFAQG